MSAADEDGASLSAAFTAEAARRQGRTNEEVTGDGSGVVREVVLRDGKPVSIPRRAPPPPASTMQDEALGLLATPQFLFGCLISVGSLALIIAIAAADGAAS